ncbi:MAG: hypothetical protein Crog4KO_17310 [Crocinitomicaceae bacterium]
MHSKSKHSTQNHLNINVSDKFNCNPYYKKARKNTSTGLLTILMTKLTNQ